MTKLKYTQVVTNISPAMKDALEEVPRRGGCYNWIFLFKGSMTPFRMMDNYDDYDVVAVNMAPSDQLLIREVANKLKNSSTLLIANNDYIAESWNTWNQHPLQYMQLQDVPDALYGTEPHQVSCMKEGTYTIPHPHWIKMLKHIGNDDLMEDINKIGVMYHWWEGNTYLPSLALNKLRRDGVEFESRLYAYTSPSNDKSRNWSRLMYDRKMDLMSYPNFIRSLQTNKFLYEPCNYHTYGRTTVDTAALGVPSLGTDRVFSMKHCWPNMSCDPVNINKTVDIMKKVLKGGSWLDEQIDYAYDACEYFNYKTSKERYMAMVDETRDRCKK